MRQAEGFLDKGHSVLISCKVSGRFKVHQDAIKKQLSDHVHRLAERSELFRISSSSTDGLSFILVKKSNV